MNTRTPLSTIVQTATVLALGATALGQLQLDPAANYFAGIEPDGAAAGDFNGDGIMDLAVTSDQCAGCDDVAILMGNPDGTYQAPVYVLLPNSSSPGDVVAGDLDGDGDVDLAVALKDFSQVIAVLNQGAGTFVQGGTAPTGQEPRGMNIADADNDGDMDIVVGNREDSTVTFLMNNGNATFASTTMASGDDVRDAAWGDFDGDGDMDAAVASHDDRTVRVFAQTGVNSGSFAMVATLSVGGNDRPGGIATGDLNGDGLDDIATASGDDEAPAFNRAVLFTATGANAFTGPVFVASNGINTSDVAIGDFDCDGDMDLATANELSNNISVMLNSGGGAFGPATTFAAGSNPDRVIAANLGDGDGDTDLVAVNRNSSNVSVFQNHCDDGGGKPVPGDVNGDGVVNTEDLLALLAVWGDCPGCDADLNGDGVVNTEDLLAVLAAWG